MSSRGTFRVRWTEHANRREAPGIGESIVGTDAGAARLTGNVLPTNGIRDDVVVTQTETSTSPAVAGRWIFLIPIVIVVLDQILKSVMTGWLGPKAQFHRYDVIGTFAGFQYLENRGAAFGILPEQTELLTVIAIVIVVFALGVMWKEARTNVFAGAAIGLIVGGALGNIVDRIRLGYVVDFIAVGAYPKFNLADSMVTIGVVLLLWASFREERRSTFDGTEEEHDG